MEYSSRLSQSMDLWNIYLDYVSLSLMAIIEYLLRLCQSMAIME